MSFVPFSQSDSTLQLVFSQISGMANHTLPNNVPYRTINEFAENFGVNPEDLINIYLYGSHVYGTASEHSDYVVVEDNAVVPQHGTNLDNNNNQTTQVLDEYVELDDDNTIKGRDGNDVTFYQESIFVQKLKQHKQNVTECYFLPEQFIILNRRTYSMPLDIKQLRHSFSKLVGNSYAKAGKKLTVEKDLDIRKGKKSLFHSLRILMFGIQLAQYGKIVDYAEANEIWKEIEADPSVEWTHYHQKYKKEFNRLKSRFREAAPL